MQLSSILTRISIFLLLPPAIIGTTYLYLYPLFQQCSFPEAKHAEAACYFGDNITNAIPGETAPFRLLAFADPQLEGDTSIPGANEAEWWKAGEFQRLVQKYRKKLDLWGNDLYLAHVYRTMRWFTDPTHVVVLGDLLGSQWISDKEFGRRSDRFWNRVFRGGKRVPESFMQTKAVDGGVLGTDEKWKDRIITVPGNHDIGYAGDVDEARVERFEKKFGKVNWEVTFALNETSKMQTGGRLGGSNQLDPEPPRLRLMVLNSMNLDEPVKSVDLQVESRAFLSDKLYLDLPPDDTATILLTHIPLHKKAGICADSPLVSHFSSGGIKEQNFLSSDFSTVILDGVVGPELYRSSVILNGHDHAGCQTYHHKFKDLDLDAIMEEERFEEYEWEVKPYRDAATEARNSSLAGVREITVRSMMGQYSGNAGLLSAWWDRETEKWKFDYSSCECGIQHVWWAVHVLDLVAVGTGVLAVLLALVESRTETTSAEAEEAQRRKKIS